MFPLTFQFCFLSDDFLKWFTYCEISMINRQCLRLMWKREWKCAFMYLMIFKKRTRKWKEGRIKKAGGLFVAYTKSQMRLDSQGEGKAYVWRSHDKKVLDIWLKIILIFAIKIPSNLCTLKRYWKQAQAWTSLWLFDVGQIQERAVGTLWVSFPKGL